MIDISLLGTGGMIPLPNRFLTSMLARINGSMILIDCGESTQITLKQQGWGFKSLDCICFTHFHADHIAGLPGLLLTIGNSERTEPLIIIGPAGIKKVVNSLRIIAPELPFDIAFVELDLRENSVITVSLGKYNISALPLAHRIPCAGYNISLPRAGKFDAERAKQQNIPLQYWRILQNGDSVEHDGRIYTPDMVLGPERKGIKVSYITDTRPTESIPEFIYGSDLFICEGLYGEDDKLPKAEAHRHMIFSEAAELAKKGCVKELWLTHYSPAMTNPDEYIEAAQSIFENSKTGYDRMSKTILFDEILY